MNKKLLIVLSLSLVLLIGTVTMAASPVRVALVLSGFLGDQSFNDSAHQGLLRAVEDFGIELRVLESEVPADWEQNLVAMADAGYDLVIASSTQFQDILERNAGYFPHIKFGIIDGVVEQPNVVSAVFAQNEGSFLAGAAAALWTQYDHLPGVNSEKTIGWVGGMDIPVLHDFLTGYRQGAQYIDPDIRVLVSFAGSFSDPVRGKELTLSQYEQGADIVMNVASGTGNGILEAAYEEGKYAIGVDLDQDGIYPGSIVTSMLKRIDQAAYLMTQQVVEGTYEGGQVLYMDIANGGVSLTDMSVMQAALGDDFPAEILEVIEELTQKVRNGEIVVESYEGFRRN
ncbi:MAG: BMP family ABC transporter substrate-binding protein [Firmicutes bacterium]|nr:BMP family ABC transporter substrate-binding protein [Bacillota bacterium]